MTDAAASTYQFRDPRPLAGAAVIMEYVYLAATVANLVAVGLEFLTYSGQAPLAASMGPDAVIMLAAVTRIASGLTYVVAGFLFLKWTYRVTANARTFRPGMRAKPGWAVGWYFVPIAFLWKPFEYFKETWEVSRNPMSPAQVYTPGILRWWWGLWLVSIIASNVSGRLAMMDESAGVQAASDVFEMVSDGLTVPLILIVVRLLRSLSDRQYETHTSGAASVFA